MLSEVLGGAKVAFPVVGRAAFSVLLRRSTPPIRCVVSRWRARGGLLSFSYRRAGGLDVCMPSFAGFFGGKTEIPVYIYIYIYIL